MLNPSKKFVKIFIVFSFVLNAAAVLYGSIKVYRYLFPSTPKTTYFLKRDTVYEKLPVEPRDIVFIGDSHIQYFEFSEFFKGKNIKNRGIGGDKSIGVYNRLDPVISGKPKKLFIEVGINDIRLNIPLDTSMHYINNIVSKTKASSPSTEIYLMSIFPNRKYEEQRIIEYNNALKKISDTQKVSFIDYYQDFADGNRLKAAYDCGDGTHLSGDGYLKWASILKTHLD